MTTLERCEYDECFWHKNGSCDLSHITIDGMGDCAMRRKKGEGDKGRY